MTLSPPAPAPVRASAALDLQQLKAQVEDVLSAFLQGKAQRDAHHAGLPDLTLALQEFLAAGGKRIRPVLALVGWHIAGATGSYRTALHLAASLELFHAFALIHDDVMDASDTRRGRPTVHRAFAQQHGGPPQAADQYGQSAAILTGDLALIWSDELLHHGHPTPAQLAALLPLLEEMRTEITLGQYLDLAHTGPHTETDLDCALRIIRYKTAKYTIERPLHLGAALAGADRHLLHTLSAYAIPVGEAFQLRDDLLGVFGTPDTTGKPALDDLREGKATPLIALTLKRGSPGQREQLRSLLGCPTLTEDQAQTARHIITATDAPHTVEDMINHRYHQALTALEETIHLDTAGANALRLLAHQAVTRSA
ncbi:polyprenyl synthetase family protein [Streptomyces candidus]|uniref:Geranylgeranyl diphosphate synthase type I n=1 Tax=Streptomyces candidus TaxID=67283 RepID=A0A7X0HL03_9ACTN|nr:polyprenyl synthetase family protein [Streptomyces candidus]MBB6439615.1 geranylgeranyl diphosphate synthase type I [Streptomyces candidus]GHH56389.1 geranylgeranyl pyrophosphate synthase [Streptomyces candidus]